VILVANINIINLASYKNFKTKKGKSHSFQVQFAIILLKELLINPFYS